MLKDIYAPEVYEKAHENLIALEADGIMQQDEKNCLRNLVL